MALRWTTPTGCLFAIAKLVFGLIGRIAIGLLVIAGIDLLYQRWQWKKKLRMTMQEVKDERKQHELNPEIKGRMRALQMQMASKRMLQDVPTADVVVANPTHVAVALKYDSASMDAPQVIAKGADHLCERIKEIARENGVPVVEKPPLARTLYGSCEVGQSIPEGLFMAVAEVLATIYRMRKKK
jgi:flagellar biosynthetic protein FlhB